MLEHMAQQEAQNQQSFLELIGAPQEQIAQYESSAQFPADVLYGAYGAIPGAAQSQQGAAFGEAAAGLPGIFGNQLSFNQNIQSQQLAQQNALAQAQMAHSRQMAQADLAAAQSGGEGSGLTPYQAASLEMRALEFQTEQGRYAQQDELDWLKFEAELEQDEMERLERENQAAADSLLYMAVLNPELLKDKKFMERLGGALGMGSASAAGAVVGAAGAGAEAKADAIARRGEKREDIRGLIASQFGGLEPGMNKQNAVSTIMGAISTQYPKFAGWKPDRVRNMVRQHVNSQWDNYRKGGRSGSRGGPPDVSDRISSVFNDFVEGLDKPTVDQDFLRRYRNVAGYRSAMASRAVNTISGAIRDSMSGQQWKKHRPRILRLVRNYVRHNRRRFKVTPRPRPATSGGGGGGGSPNLGK